LLVLCIRSLFKAISSFPIIAPHKGYEAELILAGVKPFGLFTVFDIDDLSDPVEKRNRRGIKQMQEAVRLGKLFVVEIPVPEYLERQASSGQGYLFYQNGFENDAAAIADWLYRQWSGKDVEPLPKDIGTYFGYSERDVALWHGCGYRGLGASIAPRLYPMMRYCRYKTLLWESTLD
jgi:hypothetical protein